jgi:hypothetical protein
VSLQMCSWLTFWEHLMFTWGWYSLCVDTNCCSHLLSFACGHKLLQSSVKICVGIPQSSVKVCEWMQGSAVLCVCMRARTHAHAQVTVVCQSLFAGANYCSLMLKFIVSRSCSCSCVKIWAWEQVTIVWIVYF